MSGDKWFSVPAKHWDEWRYIFDGAAPAEKAHLSSSCPVCRCNSLYRYFSLLRTQPKEINGFMYKGPGGYWEWCSSCHSYEHMSGFVPEWWDVVSLPINHGSLAHSPELIDQAMRSLGLTK
jgi:hypothetical protein